MLLVAGAALTTIVGCASHNSILLRSAREFISPSAGADSVELSPNVTYLRVTLGRHVALMGLQALEPHANGEVQVWIGAGGEVLRLQKGRVMGVAGLPIEWRQVSLPEFPTWAAIAKTTEAYEWVRRRDVMPGYRSAVHDRLIVRSTAVPSRSEIRGYNPGTLSWFEERANPKYEGTRDLPIARYAVENDGGDETVVYGEQCLSRDVCLTWQHWYVALQRAALTASKR